MESSRWQRLDRLLDQALEIPAAQRTAWVQQQPSELRDDLNALLAEAKNLTDNDGLESGPSLQPSPVPMENGKEQSAIGPYALIRELGQGGMGTVWLANRVDRQPEREVALKLPRFWSNDAQLVAVLKRESDILASLSHPGIARLYEAGVTPDGQPWLAMEYVDGQPLHRFCSEHHPDLTARLELFLQIADAVAYAHRHLVIHRDLKPSNILVDDDGRAHLLDFGAGKIFVEEGDPDSTVTRLWGTRAMTPDYASPEQLLGEPLSVATDIYSLGVVLYELLCGRRPYSIKDMPAAKLVATLEKLSVDPPSLRTEDAKLVRRLQGDLDTIVLKMLRREPSERYPSVPALIDDVRRYLEGYPVLARPASRTYILRKFLVRHRWSVLAFGLLLGSIGIGAAMTAQQARMVADQRAQTEAVQSYLADLIRSSNPVANGPVNPTVAELLEESLQRLDSRPGLDEETRLRIKVLLVDGLTRIRGVDAVESLATRLADQARDELGADHPAAISARAVEFSGLRLPGALLDNRERFAELVAMARSTPGVDQEYLLAALLSQYRMHIQAWEFPQALGVATEAADLAQRLLGPAHPRAINAQVIHASALLRNRENALALNTAQAAYEQIRDIGRDVAGDPLYVESRLILGDALATDGKQQAAVRMLADAVEESLSLYPGQNSRAMSNLGTLARIQDRAGDLDAAIITYRRVLARFHSDDKAAEAAIRSNLVRSLVAARRHEEAVQEGEAWLSITRDETTTRFPYHTTGDAARIALALSYCWEGNAVEARRLIDEISSEYVVRRPGTMLDPAHAEAIWASLVGEHDRAIRLHETALGHMLESQGGGENRNEMHVRTALGMALLASGRRDLAAEQFDESLALYREFHHWLTPRWSETFETRIALLRQASMDAEAAVLEQEYRQLQLRSSSLQLSVSSP